MELDFIITASLLMIIFFFMSWMIIHALIQAHKTGTISIRNEFYYRKDRRRFHALEFHTIFCFQIILGLFTSLIFLGLLVLLLFQRPGQFIILLLAITNAGFTLRRAPNPHAKPDHLYSYTSILGALTIIAVSIFMLFDQQVAPLLPASLTIACSLLVALHVLRLRSGKFFFKFRKPNSISKTVKRRA